MTGQAPLNLRVARARGCKPAYRHGGWWCDEITHEPHYISDYEHDSAMVLRLLNRNHCAVRWFRDALELGVFAQTIGRYGASIEEAAWEWYCAAKAAGVEVVEP